MGEGANAPAGVSGRAVLIGTLLSLLLAFLSIAEQALGGTYTLGPDWYGAGPLFLLFVLICAATLLKRVGLIRAGLGPQEQITIFSMLSMVPAVFVVGLFLVPDLVGFAHFATPENRWDTQVLPLLPEGLVIKDATAAKGFFDGPVVRAGVPYGAWVGPLCAWAALLSALYFTMISLMVILRKRWMEQERLPFPLAQLPLSLAEGEAGERPLLHNPVFWLGFAVPTLIGMSVITNKFLPFIPAIHLYFYTRFYRGSMGLLIYSHFFVLGLSYLVSLEILGSILFFTLISYLQMYLLIFSGSPILGSPPHNYTRADQEVLGALFVLVGFGLYEARHHLRDVFRKAAGPAPEVDDGEELLSYRAAVVGLIVGIAFISYWLWMTGVSAWAVPIYVGVMLVTFLGVTRILAEAGVVMVAPVTSIQVLWSSAGAQVLGSRAMAGLFLAEPWSSPNGPHVMGNTSTLQKLTHLVGRRSRPVFSVLALALLSAVLGTTGTMLYYVYGLGASGFAYTGNVIGTIGAKLIYYGGAIVDPSSKGEPLRFLWSCIGAGVMGVLILARQRFYWWPVHPIGFAVGMTAPSWWINVLAAWLIKRNVLKYGGASLYGRTRPFFLGLIMGEAVITGIGSVVTMLTGRV